MESFRIAAKDAYGSFEFCPRIVDIAVFHGIILHDHAAVRRVGVGLLKIPGLDAVSAYIADFTVGKAVIYGAVLYIYRPVSKMQETAAVKYNSLCMVQYDTGLCFFKVGIGEFVISRIF